jgi:hypothetical protein
VTLAENSPVRIDHSNPENAAILKFQSQRHSNPFMWVSACIEIDITLDPVQTGNRKAGAFNEALEPANAILHLAERSIIGQEFPDAGAFLDQFHHATNDLSHAFW